MNSNEIESNVKRIFENFSKEEFPFDLLLAYGISKTSITRPPPWCVSHAPKLRFNQSRIIFQKHKSATQRKPN